MEIVLPRTYSLKDALLAQESRKIKMRFWDFKKEEMIDWKSADRILYKAISGSGSPRYAQMNSIAAKDKAGKQFYEGDILEMGCWTDSKSKSKKSKPCYYVLVCDVETKTTALKSLQNVAYSPFDIREAKIVGNIYENPKLLL